MKTWKFWQIPTCIYKNYHYFFSHHFKKRYYKINPVMIINIALSFTLTIEISKIIFDVKHFEFNKEFFFYEVCFFLQLI